MRPAFTLGGTGGGIVETEEAYWERVRAGLRASPIKQVMIERCLVGWQEIEYEVMRDAEDTCIAVCSMENVDPLGVHTGDSIVVAPVQTLTDTVHQRLRSAALAIIRALGVEGGCNVQFALSPDSTEYAVIEVNPRVSRSSALASKATGYPIARVAAQIAAGRTLADIPNVVTGTTVAAFEPALDYVVVKLPRFPFDKFPTADRRLGSQMKATGEVMAIDRTFGAALNKALRGLEQAGAGPLGEDPSWRPTFDYLAAVYAGVDPDEGTAPTRCPDEDAPIRWIDQRGQACESTRFAQRSAAPIVLRQFLEPSDSRLWRVLGLLRRGVPQETVRRATGISRLVPRPRWAATSRSSTTSARWGRGWRIPRTTRAPRCWRPPSGQRSRTGSSPAAGRDGGGRGPGRPPALGLVPGYAMVDTCAAEFAAETPYFYSTYASAGSPAEAPPVDRPAALVIGSGPVRIGQGIEFDYCAVQAADVLRREGWSAVMVNSNPETVSTDFDASTRLYFEPLDTESVRSIIEFESGGGAGSATADRRCRTCRPSWRSAARRRSTSQASLVAAGRPAAGLGPRGHRPGGGAHPLLGAAGPAGHPAARGRHGRVHRGGADPRRAHRLPGHRAAVVRHRRAGHRLRVLARGPRPAPRGRRDRRSRTGPSASTGSSRASRSTSTPSAMAREVLIPGLLEHVERAGDPLGRLDRRVPAAARGRGRPGA